MLFGVSWLKPKADLFMVPRAASWSLVCRTGVFEPRAGSLARDDMKPGREASIDFDKFGFFYSISLFRSAYGSSTNLDFLVWLELISGSFRLSRRAFALRNLLASIAYYPVRLTLLPRVVLLIYDFWSPRLPNAAFAWLYRIIHCAFKGSFSSILMNNFARASLYLISFFKLSLFPPPSFLVECFG